MHDIRTPGIERASRILPKSIHALGSNVEHLYYCHSVLFHWPQIVGNAIAANVEAVRIVRETLWLYSYDATWRNQIQMMQLDVLQKVNNLSSASRGRGGKRCSCGMSRWTCSIIARCCRK